MRIAFFPATFFPFIGGMEIQTHNLANEISLKKHKVDIFLLKKNNIQSRYQKIILNKLLINFIFYFKYYLNIDLNFMLKLYLKKFKNKYDLWHFQSINYKTLILLNALKEIGEKIVITFHGADIQIDNNINYGYRLDKKFNKYLKDSINKIDLFQAISNTIRQDIIKLGVNPKKIFNLSNSVDTDKIKKTKKIYKNNKKIKILIVARFAKLKKGYDLIPSLTKQLIKCNVNFRWLIAGNKTENLLQEKYIKNNKHLFEIFSEINNINEYNFPNKKLIKIYKSSDLYINLARIESFGVTMVEGMASGLPVITFNTKGANEIVKNNYNGFVIPNKSIIKMAKKIKQIQNNKKLLSVMRKNCIKYSKKFTLIKISKKLIKNYQNLN